MNPICPKEPRQVGSPTTDPGWLAGCACATPPVRTDSVAAPTGSPSLTPQHKRELAGIGAAAVLSTAIALAPLIYDDAPSILTASSITTASISLPDPPDPRERFAAARPARERASVPVQQRAGSGARRRTPDNAPTLANAAALVGVQETGLARLELERLMPEGDAVPAARRRVALDVTESERRQGGLSRLFLGSGRHRVQPFPQPSGSN